MLYVSGSARTPPPIRRQIFKVQRLIMATHQSASYFVESWSSNRLGRRQKTRGIKGQICDVCHRENFGSWPRNEDYRTVRWNEQM
jgi:hypothetical protein